MTERLYYADAYLRSFEAQVIDRLELNGRPVIILDRTAFYPEGGGQPPDRGTLNHVDVVDVQTREADDEVLHILAAPLSVEKVTGTVDAARRFDLMQQHTGQHILSQAFIHTANAETVSFHLNPDPNDGALTIDLNKGALTSAEIDRAEDFANSIVYENRLVTARFVSDEELQALPLRKPPKFDKAIRIVEIQGFDWSACGGTHVARTGEVGMIKIVKVEKSGGETRIEFRCGRRALIDYRRKHQIISQVASDLSIGFWELDRAIGRMQADGKAARKQLLEADARLQQYEARELLNSIEPRGDFGLITQVWLQRDAAYLKRMASLLVAQPKTVVLLGATGQSLALVFARSKDLSIDLGALLKAAAARLGGKGGGSPDFAQAGGPAVSEEQLQDTLHWTREQLP
ncbi:MAG TPA: DHHA1 domain-containing protein [Anaerolineae bacterium]|nr:DHHA1 domain-containing protein [Anaerolineae bacterium]